MWSRNNYSSKFWDNSTSKCHQGKAIFDRIEFQFSKVIHKDICIKVHGLWGWGLVCAAVSLSILRGATALNVFFSNLKTHKRVAKLSTSPKVTIFPPPVPYYFILDQCLKGDLWTTLISRHSIVAMDFQSLRTHKTWNILRGETYVRINLLASTH